MYKHLSKNLETHLHSLKPFKHVLLAHKEYSKGHLQQKLAHLGQLPMTKNLIGHKHLSAVKSLPSLVKAIKTHKHRDNIRSAIMENIRAFKKHEKKGGKFHIGKKGRNILIGVGSTLGAMGAIFGARRAMKPKPKKSTSTWKRPDLPIMDRPIPTKKYNPYKPVDISHIEKPYGAGLFNKKVNLLKKHGILKKTFKVKPRHLLKGSHFENIIGQAILDRVPVVGTVKRAYDTAKTAKSAVKAVKGGKIRISKKTRNILLGVTGAVGTVVAAARGRRNAKAATRKVRHSILKKDPTKNKDYMMPKLE